MATGRIPTTANSPLTAKGDIFTFSTGSAKLAVGNNGETLVADSSTSTGLAYTPTFFAGKNKIINGDFGVWQRGTSLTTNGFLADRWVLNHDTNPTSFTQSRQTFTPGTAPIAGYEGEFFWRYAITTLGTGAGVYLVNRIEDVRNFAGQTATISFWAKANANTTISAFFAQNFGSGGSATVTTTISTSLALTTSWTRFTATVAVPSVSGKTIGTSSSLQFYFNWTPTASQTIDFWGVQVEAGSVATAFQTATGTIQGELAACQRYYYRSTASQTYSSFGLGIVESGTSFDLNFNLPVTMRTAPSSVDFSTLTSQEAPGGTLRAVTGVSISTTVTSTQIATLVCTVASGLTGNRPIRVLANNSTSAFLGVNAEL